MQRRTPPDKSKLACHLYPRRCAVQSAPHSFCRTAPAVTRPHLIGNAECALLVHDGIGVSQVPGGEDDLTRTRRNALTEEGSNLAACSVSLCNGCPCRLCTIQVLAPA